MPLCNPSRPRLTIHLRLASALLVFVTGATVSLRAQQPIPSAAAPSALTESSSVTSSDAFPATVASADLPDAPSALLYPQATQTTTPPQQTQTANPDAVSANGTQQTKRILGIMPNFSAVSADTKLPPQTAKEKFILAGKNSFDYSSFLIAGIQAGFAMNGDSYPEFHQGLKGYGRYYWHTLADTADENFFVSGVGPIVFHQDNRFYTLGHGGFRKRAWYAATRILITRQDDGRADFNFSEVIGSGASAGVSTLYYPTKYRTWTKVGQKWLTSDIIDAANFTFKEFWPDINKKIFHTH
jgi:hypothetical protein